MFEPKADHWFESYHLTQREMAARLIGGTVHLFGPEVGALTRWQIQALQEIRRERKPDQVVDDALEKDMSVLNEMPQDQFDDLLSMPLPVATDDEDEFSDL